MATPSKTKPTLSSPLEEEEDLDELDDVLDQFTPATTTTTSSTTKASTTTTQQPQSPRLPAPPPPTATFGRPRTNTRGAGLDPTEEMDEDALSAEFARELAKGMESLMREISGGSLPGEERKDGEGQGQGEAGKGKDGDEEETARMFKAAWEKMLVEEMNGMGAGDKSLEGLQEFLGQGQGAAKDAAAGKGKAAEGQSTAGAGTTSDFQSKIRQAMDRIRESESNLQADSASKSTAGPAGATPDSLEALLSSLKDLSVGEGEDEDELAGILEGMMEQLMGKEILEEPLRELADKFPGYLENPPAPLPREERERYEKQLSSVRQILAVFDKPSYSDKNPEDRKTISDLMAELQSYGSPPSEIMGPLPAGFNLGPDDKAATYNIYFYLAAGSRAGDKSFDTPERLSGGNLYNHNWRGAAPRLPPHPSFPQMPRDPEESSQTPTLGSEGKHANGQVNEESSDVIVVDWEGPTDPANPKNWTYRRKWAATLVVSSFTFISPISSSMVAPAAAQVAKEFGVTSTAVIAMMTSVFVLGYAFGPLILGPLSEIFGRSRVLQLANLFYFAWNLGCGFAQSKGQFIAFRFLAGLGGSAPLSIGGGVLGDVWQPEERGKAIAIYSLAPLLGPVVGPVCGAWIAQRSTWRWVFWSTSAVDAAIQVSGLFFLQETFAPLLLERKAEKIRKTMDVEKGEKKAVRTIFEAKGVERSWPHIFRKALTRPFLLFWHEQIMQLLGVYMAFIYGLLYLFLTTMPAIFADIYHHKPGIAGLHYIALGVGLTCASQMNARFMDRIYRYFKNKNNGVGEPEFRLPSMVPGTIFLPLGLLLSGWAAQHHLHWIVTDIGIAFVGAGTILVFQSVQTYVVDAFTLHAASALAAVSFLRSMAGFGFPLFAPAMYKALGYGKGDTILAAVAIALGCPAPWLFWKFGKQIRMKSKYAHKQ
ncbi:putative mfs polyamine transporter [Lyophyllum shimeji]|uniref:Mfs polyamine transporter n=1 Tax=Lyophyllum shimeji TaxID=47721 RepID=A0A9P3PRU4_LYOSH|nr:putative mfs polyamine transporter [Lyophyllum shimeji]